MKHEHEWVHDGSRFRCECGLRTAELRNGAWVIKQAATV